MIADAEPAVTMLVVASAPSFFEASPLSNTFSRNEAISFAISFTTNETTSISELLATDLPIIVSAPARKPPRSTDTNLPACSVSSVNSLANATLMLSPLLSVHTGILIVPLTEYFCAFSKIGHISETFSIICCAIDTGMIAPFEPISTFARCSTTAPAFSLI